MDYRRLTKVPYEKDYYQFYIFALWKALKLEKGVAKNSYEKEALFSSIFMDNSYEEGFYTETKIWENQFRWVDERWGPHMFFSTYIFAW